MASSPTPAASSGVANNVAGLLCYVPLFGLGLVISIVFLLIEPYNKSRFVRFHAFQSIFLHVAVVAIWIGVFILSLIFGMITKGLGFFLMGPLMWLIWLAAMVIAVVMMLKAYGNEEFKLPIIGDLAAKQVGA